MKLKISSTKCYVCVICLLVSYFIVASAQDSEDLKPVITVLEITNSMLEYVNGVNEEANPGKAFSNISKALGNLGPSMIAASSNFSKNVLVPLEEESPELKALNAGFEKVNLKLDVITSEIKNLRNIAELSNARSAYVQSVTAISNNYEALEEAKAENEKKSYDYFVKLYESSYNDAADHIYDAMIGKLGPFGFNLVSLYKDHVRCNPTMVSKFCTMGLQMIVKALVVEGAYLGAMDFSSKIKPKEENWKAKLKTLSDSCESVITKCEQDWKVSSAQQFRETYKRELSSDNQDLAEKIVKALKEVVPQRNWLAVAYDDASGNSEHTYSSYYEFDQIWNQNNHDVTIFSAPVQETLAGSKYDQFKALIDGQKEKMAAIEDCYKADWSSMKKESYGGNDSKLIVSFIRDSFRNGVVYSIRLDKKPGYAATGNTLYASVQEWKCTKQNYRIVIFL